jgi:nitric oxide dioxygenase
MTPEQVTLVQQTFAQVVPVADGAAEAFYGRLFDVAPAVKPLFRGDMTEQRRKLIASLAVVVRGLSDLPSVLPAASARRGAAVDVGARIGATVDSGGRVGVDGRLYDVVRLYD